MRRRKLGFLCLALIGLLPALAPLAAQAGSEAPSPVISIGAEAGYDNQANKSLVGSGRIGLDLSSAYFDIVAKLSLEADGTYGPAEANLPGKEFFGLYFMMEEGGVRTHVGPLSFDAGRFRHYDVIDSPYSLFVNGQGRSANLMKLRYEDDFFFYESRWIELSWRNAVDTPAWPTGYIDRGANVKTYGFKPAPGMRFGFQDAAVYTGRNFDFEYFLNPIPQYFIQYAKTDNGRPWTTGGNEGNMIGLFWDWKREDGLSLNAQVLMDDFNIHFIAPDTPWQPWKLAWTLGGRLETRLGSFGLYHAGALKYTFEPISMRDPLDWKGKAYGYTYYPDTRFDYDSSTLEPISIEDNALGYVYGENNAALRGDWRGSLGGFDLGAALELRLMGNNSPANPWQDSDSHPGDGSHWLDDPLLEKRILGNLSVSRAFGDWRLGVALRAGIALDALELRQPDVSGITTPSAGDQDIWIYAPVEGNDKLILRLTLGASYAWRLR